MTLACLPGSDVFFLWVWGFVSLRSTPGFLTLIYYVAKASAVSWCLENAEGGGAEARKGYTFSSHLE